MAAQCDVPSQVARPMGAPGEWKRSRACSGLCVRKVDFDVCAPGTREAIQSFLSGGEPVSAWCRKFGYCCRSYLHEHHFHARLTRVRAAEAGALLVFDASRSAA
jgi:hypothetical protein